MRTRFNLFLGHVGLAEFFFDRVVNSPFDRTGTHNRTNTSTSGSGCNSARAKNRSAQTSQNSGGGCTQRVYYCVNRSNSESFDSGFNLIPNTFVLGILHDAGDLSGVFLGLCAVQIANVIFYALDRVGYITTRTKGISNQAHAGGQTRNSF